MKHTKRNGWKVMPVLVAAYLFVFQIVLGSFAIASAASSNTGLDAFGNPLCITHVQDDGGAEQNDGAKLPDCCTQACGMFAPLLAPQSAGHFISNRLEHRVHSVQPDRDTGPFERPETDPGNPRAPPVAV